MESTDTTTQQLMFSIIHVWKEGGKPQLEFCKEMDIAYSNFRYWLRRHNAQGAPGKNWPAFMAVTLKKQPVVRSSIK